MKDCNKEIAHTDETQIECCGIYPTNCSVTSEADLFLKWKKGETLTNALKKISDFIKKLNGYITTLEYTANISQTLANPPSVNEFVKTVNATAAYSYVSTGVYKLTFNTPILDVTKTFVSFPSNKFSHINEVEVTSTTEITIRSYSTSTAALTDGLIDKDVLTIKIKR